MDGKPFRQCRMRKLKVMTQGSFLSGAIISIFFFKWLHAYTVKLFWNDCSSRSVCVNRRKHNSSRCARVVTHSLNEALRTSSVGSQRLEQMSNTNSTTRPYLPQRQEIDITSAIADQRDNNQETLPCLTWFSVTGGRNRI